MRKWVTKKNIYLMILLVISLLGLVISPTYAKFPSNYVTDNDMVGMSLDFNIGITNIEEYEEITVASKSAEIFNVEIENITSDTMYYGVWYKTNISDEIFNNITIARLEGTETITSDSINSNEKKTVSIIIINKSEENITVNVGVASSNISINDIEYLGGKTLITGTAVLDPNEPNLDSGNLIPVYYDSTNEVWKKADSTNEDNNWYDYNNKMWANAILKDENTVIDLSNNINNGTVNGALWDKSNKIITTDGVDDYIDLGLANYDFGDDLTFVIRVKFNSITSSDNNKYILGNWESGGGGFFLSNSNKIFFELCINGEYVQYISNIVPTTGVWYTLVATYDGSNIVVYVNGTKGSTNTVSASGTITTSTTSLVVGGNPKSDGTVSEFSTFITSDVLIFDRALTASEVSSDYADVPNPTNKEDLLVYYDFSDNGDIPIDTTISDSSDDGTLAFYVWIPRFKYRVWNITRQGGDESTYAYNAYTDGIDIKFESGISTTGNVECTYDTSTSESTTNLSDTCVYNNIDTITTSSSNSSYNDAWYTHPAFTFGDKEIKGFWIGKFETTGTNTEPTILPDLSSLTSQTVSEQFTTSKVFQNYLSNNIDARMLTNLEWGAVAYLTHSIYGLCDNTTCQDVYINNSSSYYTGRSGGAISNSSDLTLANVYPDNSTETTKYNSTGYYTYKGYFIDYDSDITTTKDESKVGSTTRNITGVYDMSGGANEYVMGNMVNRSNEFYPSSSGTNWNGSSTLDTKYYNSYSYGNATIKQAAFNRTRLGDAMGEIIGSTSGSTSAWKPNDGVTGAYSFFASMLGSWFYRGGNYDSDSASTFYFSTYYGGGGNKNTFRSVLS